MLDSAFARNLRDQGLETAVPLATGVAALTPPEVGVQSQEPAQGTTEAVQPPLGSSVGTAFLSLDSPEMAQRKDPQLF